MYLKEALYKIWQLFPLKLTNKIDILRRSFLWRKHNVIFIHVPKAAGVSVNKAIYGKPLGHFYADEIKATCPHVYNTAFKFSVVRHPIDRLYSAFNFSKTGGTSVMRMKNSEYYVDNPYFKSFESFVYNWLTKQDLKSIDHVFRPQYLYLFDKGDNLLVDAFYKLEEIEDYYHEISQNIGRSFSLGRHNISQKESYEVSSELRSFIYKIYIKDFELLGYSK